MELPNSISTDLLPKQSFSKLLQNLLSNCWLIYTLEFFIEIPFTLIISGSTIYNIDIQHFSEMQAGVIFTLIGLAVGISAVGFSSFPIKYGLKLSLVYANILGFLTNLLLYTFDDRYFQVVVMFTLFIPCISLNFISLKLAIKNMTDDQSRSLGFSMFYAVFFIASGLSAICTDIFLSTFGVIRKPFDYIFLLNVCSFGIALVLTYQLDPERIENSCQDSNQSSWNYTKEVLTSQKFWKFFSLILLLSVIKSMFFHLNATLPTFMYRKLGEGAHFGYVMAVHQLVLVACTPVLTVLTRFFSSYSLLIIGSVFTSLSALVFGFGSSYLTVTCFAVLISIGEAIYSPRLIDYTLQVAPKGKEAIYIGIANVPNFLSLLVTGISSGVLLTVFCPKANNEKCGMIWFWIGGYSFFTCCVLIALKSFFTRNVC